MDGNGHLDAEELDIALQKAGQPSLIKLLNNFLTLGIGITLTPTTLTDFMITLTASPHSHAISFSEFRDFLLLLPRKVSTAEIYRFYEVKKFMGDDGRGAARITMEGIIVSLKS